MWRDVELPEVTNPRIDLLGETGDGTLVHIELQSTNDPQMALRMLGYGLRVYKLHGKFPNQVVLYLGEAPLRMSDQLMLRGLSFQYRAVDIRELDGERLCEAHRANAPLCASRNRKQLECNCNPLAVAEPERGCPANSATDRGV